MNDELGAPDCNQPWYLDSALKRTGNLRSVAPRAALFDEIQREIDAGRPIGARIEWRDGSGHYVLIGGYGGTTQKVRVFDSLYGDSTADYLQFTVAYLGSGRWTDTYWTAPCQSLR